MKVCLKNVSGANLQDSLPVIQDFLSMLQRDLKLKKDVVIKFMNDREIDMTTGVRLDKGGIGVLADGRLLIDILRTLAHEWVHEYQYQVMGIPEDKKIQDIGGPEENMSSVLASVFLKKFQKEFPEHMDKIYGK